MQLALSNIINVSVSESQSGIGQYNTSNLALFSQEVAGNGFGNLGYKIYLEPSEVGLDYGTSSETFKMVNAVFSQQPNILTGDGYLVVIPFVNAVQHVAFSGVAASGTYILNFGGNATAAINWNDTAPQIQAKVRVLVGLEQAIVTGTSASSLSISFAGFYGPAATITVTSNSLATSVPVAVTLTITTSTVGEDLATAITRTKDLVQYFGIIASLLLVDEDVLAAAAVVQPLNKMFFFVSDDSDSLTIDTGIISQITESDFSKTRGLYYGSPTDPLVMQASYAGRGLSTNFDGSNTTQTMHLKDLIGVEPDSTMTQSFLNEAQIAGADVYASFQGVAKVYCSGANHFFDQVYNLGWLVGAVQVAGFNYLAQSSTKIPQTENGMLGLKGAYRAVCEQGITNQYGAPGSWNSSTTFGNQADFLANISQRGYYIFSQPIAQQNQAARAARSAPLVQIAFKEAGAIHSSDVIVNINA